VILTNADEGIGVIGGGLLVSMIAEQEEHSEFVVSGWGNGCISVVIVLFAGTLIVPDSFPTNGMSKNGVRGVGVGLSDLEDQVLFGMADDEPPLLGVVMVSCCVNLKILSRAAPTVTATLASVHPSELKVT
jgi:hypothetical protein